MKPAEFLAQYREHPEGFYPMCSHHLYTFPRKNEFDDVNVGWNCGLLDGNRPYFLECWAGDGLTVLTFFFSSENIETLSDRKVEQILIRNGLYLQSEDAPETTVMRFIDENSNPMYSVNVIVGDSTKEYLINDCTIFPFRQLNEMNRKA